MKEKGMWGGYRREMRREKKQTKKKKTQSRSHQRSLQAGGVVEASAHDEHALLLVQLGGQLLDLLIQTQNLLYQIYTEQVRKSTMSLFRS